MTNLVSFQDSLRLALVEEMTADESVFCLGVGVADHKRIFGTLDGVVELFGESRVIDTPIAEASLAGFTLGAAATGLRPVFIHIRVDFLLLCMDQLGNAISSLHYGSGGTVKAPLVFRAVIGRGWGQGYQHSKSMLSTFAHIPGLEVLVPSSVSQAYNLTKRAIQSDNPTLVLEHRWLYFQEGDHLKETPEDGFELHRNGTKAIFIANSWLVVEAIQAASALSSQGFEVAVISHFDLKARPPIWLIELCSQADLVIYADYDWEYLGMASQVLSDLGQGIAEISESVPKLKSLGLKDVPIPTARHLENYVYPNANEFISIVNTSLGEAFSKLPDGELFSHEKRFKGPF